MPYWARVHGGRVGSYVTLPKGSRDLYAGVPVLTTAASIRERFRERGAVIIGVDGQAHFYRMVDSTLLRTLMDDGEELCRRRCGSLRLFLWQFNGRTRADGSALGRRSITLRLRHRGELHDPSE